MSLILFESNNLEGLRPFSVNHSPVELRIGAFTNLERVQHLYKDEDIILIVRDSIKNIIEERFPDLSVNPDNIPKGLCLNSSAIFEDEKLNLVKNNDALSNCDELISFKLDRVTTLLKFREYLDKKIDITVSCDIPIIKNIWDIFKYSKRKLSSDFNEFLFNNNYIYHPSLIMINQEQIYIGPDVEIKAGVIIDASKGPVIIKKEAIIDHGTVIEGPNYIGDKTYIAPLTKVRPNNIIGPMCKVGGEISDNNFLGYSNKVHGGFLGHSYVGEWVNIGAGTNNSNLKNNYGLVKVKIENKIYSTDLQFLGSLIGDYTRIAIGTNLNTGTFIGIGANVFNHKLIDNYIASFSWGKDKKVQLDSFITTLSEMKKRREKNISSSEKEYIKQLYSK
tara:strand:+ start:238 stop:1410 length:1173 start_codon:yes stop_codon:yes gene_type:complete